MPLGTFRAKISENTKTTIVERLIFAGFHTAIKESNNYDVVLDMTTVNPSDTYRQPYYAAAYQLGPKKLNFIQLSKTQSGYILTEAGKNTMREAIAHSLPKIAAMPKLVKLKKTRKPPKAKPKKSAVSAVPIPTVDHNLQMGINSLTALATNNKLLVDTLKQIASDINEVLVQVDQANNP